MKRLSEIQNYLIFITVTDVGIEYYDAGKSPIELYNIWADKTGFKVDDPDWVAKILEHLHGMRNYDKETCIRANNQDKKKLQELKRKQQS